MTLLALDLGTQAGWDVSIQKQSINAPRRVLAKTKRAKGLVGASMMVRPAKGVGAGTVLLRNNAARMLTLGLCRVRLPARGSF
jgi:hypothetical protein